MKKKIGIIVAVTLAAVMVLALVPGVALGAKKLDRGNNFPSGPHYELGIIGRPNDYTGNGTNNSNRHNIFIPLDTEGYVEGKVKLHMQQSADGFLVVDGDATGDGVARFQLGPGYYAVFARALGKPGGNIKFDAYFTAWLDQTTLSDAIWLGNVDLTRGMNKDGQWVGKKPQTVEISKLFYYTGCIPYTAGEVCYTNEWVFDVIGFEDYWWHIANNGLKRLEVRFYEVPPGYTPPELP